MRGGVLSHSGTLLSNVWSAIAVCSECLIMVRFVRFTEVPSTADRIEGDSAEIYKYLYETCLSLNTH